MKIGITERGDGALDQSWRTALDDHTVDGAVIITKAPQLIGDLPQHTVLHCTITGLGGTVIEPHVESPEITIAAYEWFIAQYGPNRIVLRIDPILYWEPYIEKAKQIAKRRRGRMRISFIDLYPHVKERFKSAKIYSPGAFAFHGPLITRRKIWEDLGQPELCGEPGMGCTGCVSLLDIQAMGLNENRCSGDLCTQRKSCKCLAEKVELLKRREQCKHACLYCYWR